MNNFDFFSIIVIFIGLLLIIGTYFRWSFLVNPSPKFSLFYSHSALKKLFGSEFLVWYNYILGFILILSAIRFLLTD